MIAPQYEWRFSVLISKSTQPYEVTLSRKLWRTLSREGIGFRKKFAKANWPNAFRKVIKEWDYQYSLDQVLDWYSTFIGSKYTPDIRSPEKFIDKYSNIENCIKRNLIYSWWSISATEDDKNTVEGDELFNKELLRRAANFWQHKAQKEDSVHKIESGIKYILKDGTMKLPGLVRTLCYICIREKLEIKHFGEHNKTPNGKSFYEEYIQPRKDREKFSIHRIFSLGKKILSEEGYTSPLEKCHDALEKKHIYQCRFYGDQALSELLPDFAIINDKVEESYQKLTLGVQF